MEKELIERVYSQYKGMDQDYIKLVRGYHEILKDKRYSDDFKLEKRQEIKNNILNLKVEYADKALAELDKFENDLTSERPKEEPTENEQLKDIILWNQILRTMSKADFKEVWANNRNNKDFRLLAESVLIERDKKLWLAEFEGEFNSHSPLEKTIQKHRLFIRSVAGMGDSVMMIPEHNKAKKIKFTRTINKDLDEFSGSLNFKLVSGHKLG